MKKMNLTKKETIEKVLSALLGLKLSIIRRAATMRNFHFGEIKITEKGSIGDFALHVQCPWRFEKQEQLIAGSGDIWTPKDSNDLNENWNYETDGNLQDSIFEKLFGPRDQRTKSFINSGQGYIVTSVQGDALGGLVLTLSGDSKISIFPASNSDEYWRFFKPGKKEKHFVVGKLVGWE